MPGGMGIDGPGNTEPDTPLVEPVKPVLQELDVPWFAKVTLPPML